MIIRKFGCLTALAALLGTGAASAATVAQPVVTLYGAGATFPAEAYVGPAFLGLNPALRLSNTLPPAGAGLTNLYAADKKSLFTAYSVSTADATHKAGTVGMSYCQTGSGYGRGILRGSNSAALNNGAGLSRACPDYSVSTGSSSDNGISTPSGQNEPDFVGSDAPFSQSEINTLWTNKGATRGSLVEIPAVAGPISFIYKSSAFTGKQLNLTQSDVCGIFSGRITDWNQLTHTPKAAAPTSLPVKVIYRSDGSGTTFSLTNYLSAVCPTLTGGTSRETFGDVATTAGDFKTTDTWASGCSGPSSGQTCTTPGGHVSFIGFTGASGSGNMVNTVNATDGAIGYIDVADGVARAKLAGGTLKYATVSYAADQPKTTFTCNSTSTPSCAVAKVVKIPAITYTKFDPVKNFFKKGTTALALTAHADEVLNGIDSGGRPVVANLATTASTPASFVPGCTLLVRPNDYAKPTPGDVAKYTVMAGDTPVDLLNVFDFDRYPVIAVTWLDTYGAGTSTATTPSKRDGVRGLLKAAYDSAGVLKKTKTVGGKSGYGPLSLTLAPNTAATPINPAGATVQTLVDACVN